MRQRGTGRVAGVVAACSALVFAAAPVLATAPKPPAVEPPGKGSGILVYIVAALLGLAAVALCAMPSRRGHQD